MKDRLFELLGIEPGEESLISMLLTQSVFLGIFYGAFDISAHSLFLSVFNEKMLARAYVVSGIAGISLTVLYTWLGKRLIFRNFAVTNLTFITILTLALWLTLFHSPSKWVIFTVFVMLGPLNILALLCYRKSTEKLFTVQQEKRLPALLDAGIIIGIAVSCYIIPLLFLFQFRSHNILLISTGSILIVTIVQILIGGKFTFTDGRSEKTEKILRLTVLKEDSFLRIISIFITLSVLVLFFIQYSFMAVTREQYPAEEDLAKFLGLFTGTMMIFSLLVRRLLFKNILKKYGLKTCLVLSPLLLAGFIVIVIIFGMAAGSSPAGTGGFIVFFLLLALSRLFSKSLKDSVESPSLKVLFQAVGGKMHPAVQAGINGTFNEIAVLSSGILLSAVGALSFIKLIHFSWILFGIIIIWVFVASRLYLEYRKSIRKLLEPVGEHEGRAAEGHRWESLSSRASAIILFRSNLFKLVTGDLSIIDNTKSRWLFRQIIDYAEIRQDLSMLPGLKKIASRIDIDEDLRHRSAEVIDQLEETKGDPRKLKKSIRPLIEDEKLINARKTLASQRLPQTTEILRLLRNNNIESRRYAIYMIGKFRLSDMISEVANCLVIQGLEKDAMNILDSFGTEANDELYRLYLSSSGNIRVSRLIIRLLSKSQTKENTDFLFARLSSNARQVKEAAVKSLIGLEYQAAPEEKVKLQQLASEIIAIITWDISAQSFLKKNNDLVLAGVITKETASWLTFLWNLLTIAYDKDSLSRIRSGIESGTVESISYTLEMVDLLIDDTIRTDLSSLIYLMSDDEKLKNLHRFHPGEILHYEQLVEDIINRDYNLISVWVKACTMRNMKDFSRQSTEESVIALLFSPEKILQEEAARLIGRTKKEIFASVSSRIPKNSLEIPEKIISGDLHNNEYLMEKVRFLSSIFIDIPEDELLNMAGSLKYFNSISEVVLPDNSNYILWNIGPDHSEAKIFTLFGESAAEYKKEYLIGTGSFFYLLPLDVLEDFQNLYPERSYDIYNFLEDNDLK
jgi:AAA family ATP:ADP antiporter